MTSSRIGTWVLLGALLVVSGCAQSAQGSTRLDVTQDVALVVVDETGEPVRGAVFTAVGEHDYRGDEFGKISLSLSSPIAGVVTAPGKLPEPLAVAPDDVLQTVRLLDRTGDDGDRVVLHFGGDTMLGRRYQEPTRTDTATAHDGAEARAVVSDLAPLSAASDVTIVNLESIVGDLPADEAHPGKKYLIQTPDFGLDALDELGVDLVTLGNNHVNDWQEAGLRSTLRLLDEAGIQHVGAGSDGAAASRGVIVPAGSQRLGVLSMTTIDGDPLNDQLPVEATDPPPGIRESEMWQYELREFGFGTLGSPGHIANGPGLAGEVWTLYTRLEPTLGPADAADLWAAITAPNAYPELQDWIARRGHGGAAGYDAVAMSDEVARLRDAGADYVVVQFHAGYQFTDAPSAAIRTMSQAAIDAGADAVISHHPHVLQGVEWYDDKPIVYSLGNLLFDQNFLATYPSAMLRVVIDDAGLVEARFIPIVLDRYRPVAAVGEAADRIVRHLATGSRSALEAGRSAELGVVTRQLDELPAGFERAAIVHDRNTGFLVVEDVLPERPVEFVLEADRHARVAPCLQLRTSGLPKGIEYGIDLFGLGAFDDDVADRSRGSVLHWKVPSLSEDWTISQGAGPEPDDDALVLLTNANHRVSSRNLSLMGTPEHRVWLPDRAEPADAPANYSLSVDLRRFRGEQPWIRVVSYRVADDDLIRSPETFALRERIVPIEIPYDNRWHHLDIELDASIFEPVDGQSVDGLFAYFETPRAFRGTLAIDNFSLYEWRAAPAGDLPLWSEVDALRSTTDQTVRVTASGCENV